jgi:hypothetical protein
MHKPMDILESCRQSMLSEEPCDLQARLQAAGDEIQRLRGTLAASCDEERSQLWEAGPSSGGCARALAAESDIQRLTIALTTANNNAEHFERGWYLRGDALEKLEAWARVGPTEEMLRAGQEALFEVCPEHTIEEREEMAREVWTAMAALVTRPAKPNAIYSNASNGQIADPAGSLGPNV